MNPKLVKRIDPEVALELLNDLIEINNLLIKTSERSVFFQLGSLVEQIAQRVRDDE